MACSLPLLLIIGTGTRVCDASMYTVSRVAEYGLLFCFFFLVTFRQDSTEFCNSNTAAYKDAFQFFGPAGLGVLSLAILIFPHLKNV